ncbi:MAG: CotH kinase family protein [Treponemataceae bacterium]|nr:CotH kinase family protein [Treponemataceae bacterium]
MKGVILKRPNNDSTYAREIYGYNLFRQNGIWIAPRAAYTTLKIQIIDDLDLDKDGNTTEFETVNFGVYGMIEEIKKQFLKERTSKEGGGELESNKGNLWKCLWQNKGSDFVKDNATSIGEEDVELEFDKDGKITGFRRTTYDYDYKGDNELAEGKEQLLNFMEELNNLPDCTDGNNDDDDIKTIKEFYTKKMDGDLFLRTYAINVILGMWDDYWINKNNFYFYFDKNGKAYFIPYDYDNILGTNGCDTDAATKNPLEWRNLSDNENKRPLIQKILQVPEFMDAYKSYLNQYSNEDSYFDLVCLSR